MKRYLIQIPHRSPRSPSKTELLRGVLGIAVILLAFAVYIIGAIWEVWK